jgi:hypothetical protein
MKINEKAFFDGIGNPFDPNWHDPVPGENDGVYCSEISLFWGLIKIKT